ncbi:MAG: NAD(P)H-dependent oxidoreductase subunit E [Oceanipulchritudo sp.]
MSEDQMLAQLDGIIDEYKEKPGALIPVLQMAQGLYGYLPDPVLLRISEKLKIPFSEVAGVVGFYSFFSRHPQGRHQVRVCLGTACYVRGAKEVLQSLKKELGIEIGESTPDRCFSLEVGRCFGACGLAPVVMADVDVHQRVKPSKIRELLERYREEETKNPEGA